MTVSQRVCCAKKQEDKILQSWHLGALDFSLPHAGRQNTARKNSEIFKTEETDCKTGCLFHRVQAELNQQPKKKRLRNVDLWGSFTFCMQSITQ